MDGNVPAPPNPVSKALGTNNPNSYEVLCIGKFSEPPPAGDSDVGLKYTQPKCATFGSSTAADPNANPSPNSIALSLTDFNLFRLRVVDAINTLDNKIREILDASGLTCPA